MSRREQILKQLKLERVEIPGEVSAQFEKVFGSRVMPLHDFYFTKYVPTLEYLPTAIQNFGRDAYLQGIMDGLQLSKMKPDLLASLEQGL